MSMRIENHPILGQEKAADKVTIYYNGKALEAKKGEPIAATLLAHEIRLCRHTPKSKEPRGMFCGIGQCTDCIMEVNGIPNIRTCVTLVEDGMEVNTQEGVGTWGKQHA
jgi:predicted molibdopterin-dependent oxidoreductase YjgC